MCLEDMIYLFEKVGIVFLFVLYVYLNMKYVMDVWKEFGMLMIFNLIGLFINLVYLEM